MSLITRPRPTNAAMCAIREAGNVAGELRNRLERCDAKRFHLHRALMRIRWAIDNVATDHEALAEIELALADCGYPPTREEVA